MSNESNTGITIQVHYNENGVDIREILNSSISLLIEEEVKKLCGCPS